MNYQEFLERKLQYKKASGFEPGNLNSHMFGFQSDITRWAIRQGKAAIFADCGLGKGQPLGTQILTPNGWVKNTELQIGDRVISSNGKSCNITGIYPRPNQDTYRIHFSDRSSLVVDCDHLHIVRTNNDRQRGKKWRVMSTQELLNCNNLRYGHDNKSRNYDIPIVKTVVFENTEDSIITPYIMGVLLGDGHLSGNIGISSSDSEITNRVSEELPKGVALAKVKQNKYDYRIKTGLTGNRRHPFRQELYDLGLLNTRSHNKFIPEKFKRMDNRIELVRGLMDTDGYIDKCGTAQFYSVSEKLVNDFIEVTRSLGGIPTKSVKKTSLNGERKRDCFIATFSLNSMNPFYLKRKSCRWNKNSRDNGRWIDKIVFEKKQKTLCLSVDSNDQSYVTVNYIVTHNTLMQLEWAQKIHSKTNKPVLILAPLAVSKQTKMEGSKFGIPSEVVELDDERINGNNITNYQKLHKFNPDDFGAVVLDESAILKNFTGKTRKLITESFENTPYKLACTATPSPNDFMELGTHAEFLNVCTRQEMLSMFFINDTADTGTWRLKKHAHDEFWQWVCSWAVMVRKPSDLGYDDDGFILPNLNLQEHVIKHNKPTDGNLFAFEAKTLTDRRNARRDSTEERVKVAADLVNASDEQWLVWCDLNVESDMLKKTINKAVEVRGSDTDEHKTKSMLDFANGKIKCMISKPKIAGHGMNFQVCHNVIFVGLSDSYEAYYQAVRRCWRFGQEHEVNAHIIYADSEGAVIRNIQRKEKDAIEMAESMTKNMASITKNILREERNIDMAHKYDVVRRNDWTMYNGDTVEVINEIKSNSIHYSIYSPPFASLFTYSDNTRDMGNCKNEDEFIEHFAYLTDQMYRVLMPGRLMSVHCMNLSATISSDGYIGIKDFRGTLIRMFQKAGFIFHSEVCIWKDPLVQATRTKVLTLAHKQIVSDSTRCAQGLPDYIVTMRKPGDNPEKVAHPHGFEKYVGDMDEPDGHKTDDPRTNKYAHKIWQRYASPVWFDINQTRTLNERLAREKNDERHMCPLQLDTIERCLELWTNPGDLVFSPFAGIGSEGYASLQAGRKFIGVELKKSYFDVACNNLENSQKQQSFDLLGI